MATTKPKPPLEKDIEKKVCAWAKQQGCLVYKFTSPSQRSVPDRMFVLPYGTVVFIEFKAPGKVPTELQRKELLKLTDQGVRASWSDNSEQAIQWLQNRIEEDML